MFAWLTAYCGEFASWDWPVDEAQGERDNGGRGGQITRRHGRLGLDLYMYVIGCVCV